jgi:ubiquinone/menaquinone biosynthesis C-methylase UbiE
MGHFALAAARMVGPRGRVVCVDVQDKMLAVLMRRARRAGLSERLDARRATSADSGLGGLTSQVDIVLAVFVLHEVSEVPRCLSRLARTLRADGRMLLAEPVLHVKKRAFLEILAEAEKAGLAVVERPVMRRARTVLLSRPLPDSDQRQLVTSTERL